MYDERLDMIQRAVDEHFRKYEEVPRSQKQVKLMSPDILRRRKEAATRKISNVMDRFEIGQVVSAYEKTPSPRRDWLDELKMKPRTVFYVQNPRPQFIFDNRTDEPFLKWDDKSYKLWSDGERAVYMLMMPDTTLSADMEVELVGKSGEEAFSELATLASHAQEWFMASFDNREPARALPSPDKFAAELLFRLGARF